MHVNAFNRMQRVEKNLFSKSWAHLDHQQNTNSTYLNNNIQENRKVFK